MPQAQWAFRCLALVQLIKGFAHFDQYRFQREMRFGPAVGVDIAGSILSLLATLVLVWWLRDYSAMVWILLVQVTASVLGSHLVAQRRYGWTWSPSHAKRIFSFGWPLMVNGLLMYGIFQGDQFIIGSGQRLFPQSTFTLVDLAVYSVAFSVTMAPTTLIANVSTSILLPLLSRVQEHRDLFVQRYLTYTKGLALIAAFISIVFILAGGWLVTLIYGAKYEAAGDFIGWLAAMQSLRIIRVAPTIASIARGDTVITMLANIVRMSGLLGVLIVTASNLGLSWIAFSGFLGEVLAMTFLSVMVLRYHSINPILCLKPVAVALGVMALAVFANGVNIIMVAGIGLFAVGLFHRQLTTIMSQMRASIMEQDESGNRKAG
jgi:O-antigen/teichoic acid export membrane protein